MDEQIQLSRFKNVIAIDQDIYEKISFSTDQKEIIEYDIKSILDVTQVYETERQYVNTFRFYGDIEYLSPLNYMITGYTQLIDFFTVFPATAITKSIITDFKFYLLAPTTAYTALITGSTGGTFLKNYEVISELKNFELFKAGFSTNIYGEQQYAWNFNKEFNIQGKLDGLNFPLTELYLYAQYQPQLNGNSNSESMSGKTYDSSGNTIITGITVSSLTIGNIITGDVIEWNKNIFIQETLNKQEYYITTPYSAGTENLKWKYYPIIPIQLMVFEDDLQRANISGTSYSDVTSIPYYATQIDNEGNYVWRNLQDRGFIDPLTGIGVSYPFVNKKHYVFKNIIVSIKPDLNDVNTAFVFNEILFAANTFISSQPNSNLNNVGKLCNL